MRQVDSWLGVNLQTLTSSAGVFFAILSLLTAAVWALGLGEVELEHLVAQKDLRAALTWLVGFLDLLWLGLAALLLYLELVGTDGLPTARRWTLLIFASALILGWLDLASGLPLGPLSFTSRFGPKLAGVPLGWPLLWITIVLGARSTARFFDSKFSHLQLALATGLLSGLSSLLLAPLAWKTRSWWLWYPGDLHPHAGPPAGSYLAWFLLPVLLSWIMRSQPASLFRGQGPQNPQNPQRGPWIFGLLNGVFLLTYGVQQLRK